MRGRKEIRGGVQEMMASEGDHEGKKGTKGLCRRWRIVGGTQQGIRGGW